MISCKFRDPMKASGVNLLEGGIAGVAGITAQVTRFAIGHALKLRLGGLKSEEERENAQASIP